MVVLGHLFCVDSSYSRLARLKDILKWYVPKSYVTENTVQVIHENGAGFCQKTRSEMLFDKVSFT